MKKIIFTFLSCFILAGLFPVESFAAVKMNLSHLKVDNSRHYTGVMHGLVRENRERRKAFNKHEETTHNTSRIETILKDRKRVSTRPASDTEKDDILKLIMATVITDPHTLSTKMTTNLDVAKSSSDPLDRHSYIVDMTGIFAFELMDQGKIESNFETFQDFSGVDKDRFLKLFYQVKSNHRRGLEIEKKSKWLIEYYREEIANAQYQNRQKGEYNHALEMILSHKNIEISTEALQVLVNISNNDGHEYKFEAKMTLYLYLIIGRNSQIVSRIVKHFNDISEAELKRCSEPEKAFLKTMRDSEHSDVIRKEAYDFLITSLKDGAYKISILGTIVRAGKQEAICQNALEVLIGFATTANSQQIEAITWLSYIAASGEHEHNRNAALKWLIDAADNPAHSQQNWAVSCLGDIAFDGIHKDIRKAATNALIAIAEGFESKYVSDIAAYTANYKNIHQTAVRALIQIAHAGDYSSQINKVKNWLIKIIEGKNEHARQIVLTVLSETANDNYLGGALILLTDIAQNREDEHARNAALKWLIDIADNPGHSQQSEAVNKLGQIAQEGKHEDIRNDALSALVAIAKDERHSQQSKAEELLGL